MAKKIAALIPPHRVYCEPFAGGAAVFFAKEPSEVEILGDISPEIIQTYRDVRDASPAELERLAAKDWKAKKATFERFLEEKPGKDRVDRLYRQLYIYHFSWHGSGKASRGDFRGYDSHSRADFSLERFRQIQERLKHVTFKRQDAFKTIKEVNRSDAFLYLDPPYAKGVNVQFTAEPFSLERTQELIELLKSFRGKFLLSLNSATFKALKIPASWQVRRVRAPYTRFGLREGQEVLIANYPLPVEKGSIVQNPAFYPAEDERHVFVLHAHFRGASMHLDLRLQMNDILEGWTISALQPGVIQEKVESLSQAKALEKNPKVWKIDLAHGKVLPRRVRTTIQGKPREILRPGALRALPKKAEIPADWLEVEGATEKPDPGEPIPAGATRQYRGVFDILDRGEVEFGSRRPWFYEYFLHGRRFKGRYAFRLVSREEKQILPPGEAEERARGAAYWVFMSLEDQTPYVLSDEAIRKEWLPPKGVSALPKALREKVPSELRYWEMSGQKALEARARLAEVEELGGTRVEKESYRQLAEVSL